MKGKRDFRENLDFQKFPALRYKYLGVWKTSNLFWSKHISEVCRKARQKVGILYRKCYKNANNETLYLSCIRPELEYTVTVWSPHQKGQIDTLEHNAPIEIREFHHYSRSHSLTLKVPYAKTNAFYFCDTFATGMHFHRILLTSLMPNTSRVNIHSLQKHISIGKYHEFVARLYCYKCAAQVTMSTATNE